MAGPFSALALLITINVLWAASYSVVKAGLETMDAIEIVFWRFACSFAILAVLLLIRRVPIQLSKGDVARSLAAGIFLGLSHWFWVSGIDLSQAADASLLYAFEPVFGIILASIILRERMRASTIVGLLLVIGGILKLSRIDLASFTFASGAMAMGNGMIIAGIICESLFSIVLKPVAERRPAMLVTTIAFFAASLVLFLPLRVGALQAMHWGGREIVAIAYLVLVCTVAGYTIWARVMKRLPVGIMLFTIFIQPIAGALIAAAALGEQIDERIIIGGILLLAGMGTAVIGHARALKRGHPTPIAAASTS